MRKTAKSVLLILMMGLMLVVGAYAEPYGAKDAGEAEQHEQRGKRIAKELNLTSEQEQKLEQNRAAQREEMKKLFTAIKEKREDLRKELQKPQVTRANVAPIAADLEALQAQMIDRRIDGIFAVKEILTPEQFVKFQQMAEHKKEGRKERSHQGRKNKE